MSFVESLFLFFGNALPRFWLFDKTRFIFYRMAGMQVERSTIWGPLTVRPIGGCRHINIGRGCFLNTETRFGAVAKITIMEGCRIGPRVMFETANHDVSLFEDNLRQTIGQAIVVESNVWIGAGVIVLPGVRIGAGSVVAAGSVVTRNVEPHTLVAGVPAKIKRKLKATK